MTTRCIDIRTGASDGDIAAAIDALRQEHIIVLPTDTLYALVADTFSASAVAAIFRIKRRRDDQALPLMAASFQQVRQFMHLPDTAVKLARRFWPGPLTLVLPGRPSLPAHARAADGTVAVRVPDNAICREIAAKLRRPITATSTNISGAPPARNVAEIADAIRAAAMLIFDAGESQATQASTIVRATEDGLVLVRAGQISRATLIAEIGEGTIG